MNTCQGEPLAPKSSKWNLRLQPSGKQIPQLLKGMEMNPALRSRSMCQASQWERTCLAPCFCLWKPNWFLIRGNCKTAVLIEATKHPSRLLLLHFCHWNRKLAGRGCHYFYYFIMGKPGGRSPLAVGYKVSTDRHQIWTSSLERNGAIQPLDQSKLLPFACLCFPLFASVHW